MSPEGGGPSSGVHDRVGEHVGVGVAGEPALGARDLDPAQHERRPSSNRCES